MKTETFIAMLSEDIGPRRSFGAVVAIGSLCAVAAAAGAFFLSIGPRPDFAEAVRSPRFLFKFVVTITMAITAVRSVWRSGRPGTRAGLAWLVASPVLLLAAAGFELAALPAGEWTGRLIGQNARLCLSLIPLLAMAPLACLLLVLRNGAPTAPRMAGALAGLAASAIAATFYAASCMDDSPLFVVTWYPLAALIVVAIGAVAGGRLLRW